VPAPGCTIEYRGSAKSERGPVDHRCPLLGIAPRSVEFLTPERLKRDRALVLTLHTATRRSYLKLRARIESSSKKRGKPTYRTVAVFLPYSEGMAQRLRKLQDEHAPPIVASVDESSDEVEEVVEAPWPPAAEQESPDELTEADWLDRWSQLKPDMRLLHSVLEAAEAGHSLIPTPEDLDPSSAHGPPRGFMGHPVPVYRFSGDHSIEFDEEWAPRGVPVGFVSVPLHDNDGCFAVELEKAVGAESDDVSFHPGDVVVFSGGASLADNDVALIMLDDRFRLCRVSLAADGPLRLFRVGGSSSEVDLGAVRGVWRMVGVYHSADVAEPASSRDA